MQGDWFQANVLCISSSVHRYRPLFQISMNQCCWGDVTFVEHDSPFPTSPQSRVSTTNGNVKNQQHLMFLISSSPERTFEHRLFSFIIKKQEPQIHWSAALTVMFTCVTPHHLVEVSWAPKTWRWGAKWQFPLSCPLPSNRPDHSPVVWRLLPIRQWRSTWWHWWPNVAGTHRCCGRRVWKSSTTSVALFEFFCYWKPHHLCVTQSFIILLHMCASVPFQI